jgi:DNA-binding MarR family transcriptional regulator
MTNETLYLLSKLYLPGSWFQILYAHYDITKNPTEATILAYLMSRAIIKLNSKECERFLEKDMWFRCPINAIARKLHIHERTQQRTLKRLAEEGFIQIKTSGYPAHRMVRVDLTCIYTAIVKYDKKHDTFSRPDNLSVLTRQNVGVLEVDTLLNKKRKKIDHPTDSLDQSEGSDQIAGTQGSGFIFLTRSKYKWSLPESKLLAYLKNYPEIDVKRELSKAAQWCDEHPRQRKTSRGMASFLTRWMNRAKDNLVSGNGNGRCRKDYDTLGASLLKGK